MALPTPLGEQKSTAEGKKTAIMIIEQSNRTCSARKCLNSLMRAHLRVEREEQGALPLSHRDLDGAVAGKRLQHLPYDHDGAGHPSVRPRGVRPRVLVKKA